MGRIIKAEAGGAPALPPPVETEVAAEREAAQVSELLVAARAAAEAERFAVRDAAVVLARKMAERIVGHVVEMDASVMGDIAAQALLASRPSRGPIVFHVHPQDHAAVEASRSRWPSDIAALNVHIMSDPSVGRAGCMVDTPVGRLDGRLATQLDALERALLSAGRRP